MTMYASYHETYSENVENIAKNVDAESYMNEIKIISKTTIHSQFSQMEKGSNTDDVTVIHKKFKDAEKCLRSMELESKTNMEQRKQVQKMQKDLKALSSRFDKEIAGMHKRGLLGEIQNQKAIQKRLMDAEAKIEDGTRMVREANQMAADSERIGQEIISDLSAQRETIMRTKANVGVVGQELNQASGTLKEIEKPWWKIW